MLIRGVGEVIRRIHRVVAEKFEQIAMPLVRSGLGDDTDHAARSKTITRIKVVADDVEFLSRIGVGEGRRQR